MGCSPNPWGRAPMVPLDSHACIRTSPCALRAWFHVLRQATGNILLMCSFRDYSVARAIGKWLPECAEQTRGRKPFKRVGGIQKGAPFCAQVPRRFALTSLVLPA
jgi:hypothetical protein